MNDFKLTIRDAVPSDWATLAEFNIRLAAESENKQLDRATIESGVRAFLADPAKGRYFVACVGDQIVGQLAHTREWSDWRNGDIWWLQSVYVHPDFRRCGVFRQLTQHVEDLAAADPGVVGLRLYVEVENERAQMTYKSLQFKDARYTVMERLFARPDTFAVKEL